MSWHADGSHCNTPKECSLRSQYKCWAAYDGEHDCDDPTTERSCWWGEDANAEEIAEHEDDVRRYGLLPRNPETYQ